MLASPFRLFQILLPRLLILGVTRLPFVDRGLDPLALLRRSLFAPAHFFPATVLLICHCSLSFRSVSFRQPTSSRGRPPPGPIAKSLPASGKVMVGVPCFRGPEVSDSHA